VRLVYPFGALDTPVEGVLHAQDILFQNLANTANADVPVLPELDTIDTFYIYHRSRIVNLYRKWTTLLPTVEPYYAIKCNPDPILLDTLAECGACFDAASPAEIDAALHRVPESKIIYANPCKPTHDIKYASARSVNLSTFDNENEYDKIAAASVSTGRAKVILRIYANDTSAKCVLSNKYGAMPDEWHRILEYIREKTNLADQAPEVIGISFHIGSGANDPAAFARAISAAHAVFGMAGKMGFDFSILDIGGGFTHDNIERMANTITTSLEAFKADYPNVRVIAEPGRYFAESIADLYTKIIGVRTRQAEGTRHYWINDSLYGSFNCIMYDYAKPVPISLTLHNEPKVSSTIWGSTCDGMDKIAEDAKLPILAIGDWLRWDKMGAYTQAGATHFNGIPFANIKKFYL